MAWRYCNPTTGQTATTSSDKADKDGNIGILIDNIKYIQINYDEFIQHFYSMIEYSDDKHQQSKFANK